MDRAQRIEAQVNKAAQDLIGRLTTEQLVETFIKTGTVNDPEIPTVRGWIMDELERRDPEAYDRWLDNEWSDESLRKYFK